MFRVLGEFTEDRAGHPIDYFKERNISLDFRGELKIHPSVIFGFDISIWTLSHDKYNLDNLNKTVKRPVTIGANCFIGSNVVLYNCELSENTFVCIGSVLKNVRTIHYSMWNGNPAKLIATKHMEKNEWIYEP